MKKQGTRIFGGLIVALIMATIGAVLVSAENENASETEDWHLPFHGRENMFGHRAFDNELTDEQQAEIDALITSLNEEGASTEEIREVVNEKLEEYGIEVPTPEEIIDEKIEKTEQKLEILKRVKELLAENPDLTKEEIREIIQEEFELEFPENGNDMMHRHRGKCGRFGPRGFMSGEETE